MAFLHPDLVEILPSPFGKGLFATRDIPAHTIVCNVTGPLLSFEETVALGERESHSLQTGINKYILCDPPFLYSNHACNPNCALNEHLEFYTLVPLKKGEELFWDYSTSMLERHWQMQCACGHESCRKLIRDFDLLTTPLQHRYLQMNIVLPFIKEHVHIIQDELNARA